ncbi:MAG: hypothetical protein A3D24_05025 [Candidatus Blackburnbacteria bacterium RIFCSPHIGHO2_02_FULL_39_13]|uniref:Addiction module toxin, RelE/StbE family n=2 Tax=Patescibacteria group TaxID=1783273 RepID=A0A0G1CBX5_9BACT|nr:MAG: hypothetical protein UV20_C0016G0015 [Candidatus Magasanikbacteria bacterium GW2011_GWA2_42_32]OGY07427.1 MAG: hypothetical protein A2694_03170 [Candidatus Blackburnbacteria bacterium RIFCSPHIGHO2_01_FULL_40_17]OGY08967.1 MAG: hypothetical protein A3D24_05025 [Candidatus Blackburnbacteria bacterium RIFCSPHIGHO2_02_FULL_39_13]OGY13390.1 MAG: hypothetical protein A3A77_04435 [Candidatus Blackburnbacteria bacterium RIFCSPLOWO2_01_FULL_40_20]HBL52138.1 hypothetical protein [Candidatus Black
MYKLLISSKANREIRKISRLHKEAIINALYELKQNPLEGKPLTKELTGRLSYRVGFYRIIYTVNRKDQIVRIVTAGHRATIYN